MSDIKGKPHFDDMGNFVGLEGSPLIRVDEDKNVLSVHKPISPDRLLDRNVGCGNCLHFDSDLHFLERVQTRFTSDLLALKNKGVRPDFARRKASQIRTMVLDKRGALGVCKINACVDEKRGVVADYVPKTFLCGDGGGVCRWVGRDGASLARLPGEKLSPHMTEEYDKRGETAPMLKTGPDEKREGPVE
jgi:hypothetical protein